MYTHTRVILTFINAPEKRTFHIRLSTGESRYYKFKENFIEEAAKGKVLHISANYKILLVYLKRSTF